MPILRLSVCLALLGGFTACIERSAPSLGQVFAGPATLPLREDIQIRSKVVAEVHHGDKLDIVGRRRRIYRLRTSKGIEGWTDERNLMSVEQMAALRDLERQARQLPLQGIAGSYEPLNVHTEPQRFAPSFLQLRENEKFSVVAHQTAPRVERARRVLVKPRPKSVANRKRSDRKRGPAPPSPRAPKLPDDWVGLSAERQPAPPPAGQKSKPEDEEDDVPEPVPTDDWTLIRTSKGAAGWVLTNRIYMAIPDEVAQYAEGHRITTYFSLGTIHDAELNEDKNIWLWTTVHSGRYPYDFDSFRVFTWNPRRHRYETAYIQRRVEGYLPVLVKKEGGQESFSVCLADDQDTRVRKRYVIIDRQVKAADAEPCSSAPILQTKSVAAAVPAPAPEKSVVEKLREKAGNLKQRLSGK